MKIGILGSGEVARTLAGGFLQHGHDVKLGTRDSGKLAAWATQNPRAAVGGFDEAAAFGELLVLAVKGTAVPAVLGAAGATNLAGKPVIDTTNPIADAPPSNGVLRFFTNLDQSLMERSQHDFPDVRFVKAFNSVGSVRMVDPQFAEGRPTMCTSAVSSVSWPRSIAMPSPIPGRAPSLKRMSTMEPRTAVRRPARCAPPPVKGSAITHLLRHDDFRVVTIPSRGQVILMHGKCTRHPGRRSSSEASPVRWCRRPRPASARRPA